ncbi:MAG: hypothetical protein B7Y41_02930 [Hydrogenophilales bacterium 28-61-23]|nr:MAG: hypothetical protein B7Y41_02930 [Hydrogenophilales bacterium 28-61-23]
MERGRPIFVKGIAMNTAPLEQADDTLFLIEDEAPPGTTPATEHAWRILIVDDDEQVHTTTLYALANLRILNRPLAFLHAYDSEQARRLLRDEPDIAVVFLDVVMDTEDAGLQLVRVIRDELKLEDIRIILRTGQPGYAPELDVISGYDINDYRTKAELTRTRLVTSLTSALRSYEQIRTIVYSRRGLEKIVHAASELFEQHGLESLSEGVLTQISGLLGISASGLICAQKGYPLDGSHPERLYVCGAMGRYASAINHALDNLGDARIENAIMECMRNRANLYQDNYTVLYLRSTGGSEEAIFLDSSAPLRGVDRQLLEVFATNISAGFSNVYLFQKLNYLAYFDSLTGLPNRQRLEQILESDWRKRGAPYVLAILDMDHFSDIQDVMGGAIAAGAMEAIAQRLRDGLPAGTTLARFAYDVLAIVGAPNQISGEILLELFHEPFEVAGFSLPISTSAGLSLCDAGLNGQEAISNASLALSQAKRASRGRCITFTNDLAESSRQRLHLTQALRRAIQDNQLQLHYQPQVDLHSGRLIGAEALLRWQSLDGQFVSPMLFIPLAEQSGLILQLGQWIMHESCRQLADWRGKGLDDIRVAINVSPQQIKHGICATQLKQAMQAHNIRPEQIEVEITESMVLEDIDAAIACLNCFKQTGVTLALDDFGTGFSSLSYLHRLPINLLKVDRAFLREIGQADSQSVRIGEMIVALGKLLKIRILAEGVETQLQLDTVRAWGCDSAQGYFYSPALSPDAYLDWAKNYRSAGAA